MHWVATGRGLEPSCALTDAELAAVRDRIARDLVAGVPPVAPGRRPHCVVLVGAPGSGKSTWGPRLARRLFRRPYVDVDGDRAIRWHPLWPELFRLRDAVSGAPLPVADASRFQACMQAVLPAYVDAYEALRDARTHNLCLHGTLAVDNLLEAAAHGYETAAIYLDVPLAVAMRRARARVPDTGLFVSEAAVVAQWREHRRNLPAIVRLADRTFWVDAGTEGGADDGHRPPRIHEITDVGRGRRHRDACVRRLVRRWGGPDGADDVNIDAEGPCDGDDEGDRGAHRRPPGEGEGVILGEPLPPRR